MRAKERAAARIQAGFRGYRVRKQLRMARQQGKRLNGPRLLNSSQGADRGDAEPALQQHQQQQGQAVAEEIAPPASPDRGDLAEEEKAETEVASPASPSEQSEKEGEEEEEEEEALELCATKIQAGVRGFLVRRRRLAQHRAACTIQAGFRAFRARRDARLRAAAKI